MRKQIAFKIAMTMAFGLSLSACTHKSPTAMGLQNGLDQAAGMNGDQIAGAAIPGSAAEFSNVGDRVYFLNDQTDLSGEAQSTLLQQASWLQKYRGVTIQIEGHADERGTREYNIALSARRATSTRQFLIAHGIAAARISSIAYGKERPVKLCDSEQCWSQNRRAVTVITGGANAS